MYSKICTFSYGERFQIVGQKVFSDAYESWKELSSLFKPLILYMRVLVLSLMIGPELLTQATYLLISRILTSR